MSYLKRSQKKIEKRSKRRAFRVKNKQQSWGLFPRVAVFRSLNHIYAQIIDDSIGSTIVSFSSLNLKEKKADKKAIAKEVGLQLGKLALGKSLEKVFFDRGRYLYHGRVKALAEGLREGGLKF
ncbi:MAG: 50S ribosomal protein L18 [candidate division TM6 bacterium GW2011_GWF2_28_16]|nr:MAG: 50S ribosomal protein L18 [candidate division TM6 bacterium GW2011_GWF2_28_16]